MLAAKLSTGSLPAFMAFFSSSSPAQLNATHSNLKQYVMELRLDLHTRIRDVKAKLLTHNGTSIEHMLLQLQDSDGTPLRMMDDDDKPLGFYSPQNGMNIHVIDTDPFSLSRDGAWDAVTLLVLLVHPAIKGKHCQAYSRLLTAILHNCPCRRPG